MVRIGFLYSRLRVEEKMLLEELDKDARMWRLCASWTAKNISTLPRSRRMWMCFLCARCPTRAGFTFQRIFEAHGIPSVNASRVAERCGDKYITSQILARDGHPHAAGADGL